MAECGRGIPGDGVHDNDVPGWWQKGRKLDHTLRHGI